jgi:hypothetical protein
MTAIHPAIDRAANLSDTAFSLVRHRLPVGGVTFPSSRRNRATFLAIGSIAGKTDFFGPGRHNRDIRNAETDLGKISAAGPLVSLISRAFG